MPTVTVNEEPRTFPDPTTVADLLRALGKDPGKLAVEVNREVVPRADHPARRLADGDAVEIVTLVGGGSGPPADKPLKVGTFTFTSRLFTGTGKYASPELMQRMGDLLEEITKAGVMLDTAGLLPSAQGKRVHWAGGELSVTDGPFTETKEVVGGYALMQCKDMDEAVEWTTRFLKVHEEHWTVTCEVREIAEG